MKLPNIDIRNEARSAGVPLYRIAERMGIRPESLSRKLRSLKEDEKEQIRNIIKEEAQ